MAWRRRDLRRYRRQVRAITRYERWANRFENFAQWAVPRLTQVRAWLDARVTAGNAWLDRQAAQPDLWAAVTGWWRARRATKRARAALDAGPRRHVQGTVQDAVQDTGPDGPRSTDDTWSGRAGSERDGGRP
jgi:hypothetical protein